MRTWLRTGAPTFALGLLLVSARPLPAAHRMDPALAPRLARLCDPSLTPDRDGDVVWKPVCAGFTWLGSGRAGLQILLLAAVPDETRWSRPVYALVLRAQGPLPVADWATGEAADLVPVGDGEAAGLAHRDVLRMAGVAMRTLGDHLENARKGKMDLYLAGADLGGAVAAMTGALLLAQHVPAQRLTVYTFGAPPFGDAALAARLNDRLALYRIERDGDPVPDLLTAAQGFQAAGHAFKLVDRLEGVGTKDAVLRTVLEPTTDLEAQPAAATPAPVGALTQADLAAVDTRMQIFHPIATYVKALDALGR